MRARTGQIDVTQTLATNFCLRDFDAALVADDAAVLHALVLAAETLPVGDRPKDARAEQPVTLGLERAVIDRLGLGHFTVRPLADLFRRSQRDANRLKVRRELRFLLLESKHVVLHFQFAISNCRFTESRALRVNWKSAIDNRQ